MHMMPGATRLRLNNRNSPATAVIAGSAQVAIQAAAASVSPQRRALGLRTLAAVRGQAGDQAAADSFAEASKT